MLPSSLINFKHGQIFFIITVSLKFHWQTVISQSACTGETHHSFDHQFNLKIQESFPFGNARLQKGVRLEWESNTCWYTTRALSHSSWTLHQWVGYSLSWCHFNFARAKLFVVVVAAKETLNCAHPWHIQFIGFSSSLQAHTAHSLCPSLLQKQTNKKS